MYHRLPVWCRGVSLIQDLYRFGACALLFFSFQGTVNAQSASRTTGYGVAVFTSDLGIRYFNLHGEPVAIPGRVPDGDQESNPGGNLTRSEVLQRAPAIRTHLSERVLAGATSPSGNRLLIMVRTSETVWQETSILPVLRYVLEDFGQGRTTDLFSTVSSLYNNPRYTFNIVGWVSETAVLLEAVGVGYEEHEGLWLYDVDRREFSALSVPLTYASTPTLAPDRSAILFGVRSQGVPLDEGEGYDQVWIYRFADSQAVNLGSALSIAGWIVIPAVNQTDAARDGQAGHFSTRSANGCSLPNQPQLVLPFPCGSSYCVSRDGPVPLSDQVSTMPGSGNSGATGPDGSGGYYCNRTGVAYSDCGLTIGSSAIGCYLPAQTCGHSTPAIDFTDPNTTAAPILAAASGTVVYADYEDPNPNLGCGLFVQLLHDDGSGNLSHTMYCHLSSIAVTLGSQVAQGQVIGYEGSTGASTGEHLHFALRDDPGTPGNNYYPIITSSNYGDFTPRAPYQYVSQTNCCEDNEPNDSWIEAELLQSNGSYDLCLQTMDSEDWYLFAVSQEGELTIEIDNISNPLIYFELYDAGMDVVASDLSGTTGPKAFTYCWPGGMSCTPLYLRVWPDVVFNNVVRTYSLTSAWDPGVSCFTSLLPPSYSVILDPSPTCAGQNVSLEAIPGGAVSYTWHSAANGGGPVVGSTAAITVAPTSSATYSVVIAPSCNPVHNVTINGPLTVLAVPTANAGANQTIASGGSTVLAGSGGSTYSWAPSATLSNPNIWNPIASPTVTTTYTLTVTNANGCTDIDQVTITVTGTGGGAAPANDAACGATPLSVGSSCSYITGTNIGATGSSVPTPTTCAASSTSSNPSGNYQGGDVWYSVVVPSSGQLVVQTQIQSSVTDLVMVAYTGTSCSSLTQLACSDDQVPGSNYMPRLNLTGLTPGTTLRLRVYEFGNNTFGNFGICAYNPGGGSSTGRDLISWITAVSDNTVDQGDNISVTYKVKNIGTLNVTTPFLSAVYLSADPNYSSGSDELVDGSIEAFISLNAGQEYTSTNTVTIPNEPDGNYYLISFADAAYAVGETSESNNFGYAPIQLGNLIPDGPNLEVDDVDVISNVGLAPGQEVDVAVRLENTGTDDSDACDVLVVFDINDNHQYDPGIDPILESIIFPSLEPGEDDTRTRDVLLPTNIPSTGGYDIIAIADINNECNETDESDQEGSEEVQIVTLTPAGPDLVPAFLWIELPSPSDEQVDSENLCISDSYDIYYSTTNIGNLDVPSGGSVSTSLYISHDPVLSGDDDIWDAGSSMASTLDVGVTKIYHDDSFFEGMSPGPAYIIVITDRNNLVQETNEANNVVAYPIYILPCGAILPDLSGSIDYYSPYASALGDTISTQLRIWNGGSVLAAPPITLSLYISDDEQYDGDGSTGVSDVDLDGPGYLHITDTIYPGDTLSLTLSGYSHSLTSTGQKYLFLSIDDGDDLNEMDVSNNIISVPIEINSIACWYNIEWLDLASGYASYEGYFGSPILVHTDDACLWTLTETVNWAGGTGDTPQTGSSVYSLQIASNPYPVERTLQLMLNGSIPISIVQEARPCSLVGDSLLPDVTATLTNATCGLANGTIDVSATGHYLPLQYMWSTVETTEDIGSLLPGSYNLTVTDAAGCTLDTSFTILNTGSACTPVQLYANLEGPFNGANMNDALRQAGLIPAVEPYTALGLHVGPGGGEMVTLDRLLVEGDSAIVDWILVELRSSSDPTTVLETRSALLLRNGAIVSPVGSHTLVFGYASGSFNLAVRHRNHLGVMSGAAVEFTGSSITIDFRSTTTSTWGTEAQKTIGSVHAMWAGNTSGDDMLKYTGPNNDRDPILVRIGGVIPTNTVSGYFLEDCNLNGMVQYTGSMNDRDPILVNIGGVIPTNTRQEQLP